MPVALISDNFWDTPINGPMICKIIGAWTASYASRQAAYLSKVDGERREFFRELYARQYPQRFMEFSLCDRGTVTAYKITHGMCGCPESHDITSAQIAAEFALIGRPWNRLSCAMRIAGIASVPSREPFSARRILSMLDDAFHETPALAQRMGWAMEEVENREDEFDWARADVARARGVLYARLMLTFRLPEMLNGKDFIFPYHEFDQIFEEGLGDKEVGAYVVTLCEMALQRLEAAKQRASLAAERIYRAFPGTEERDFTLTWLSLYPDLAGVNLKSASEILAYFHQDMPPHDLVDDNNWNAMAIRVARIFGKNWRRWVDRFGGNGAYAAIHDAAQPLPDLPLAQQKALGRYLITHVRSDIVTLGVVCRNWASVSDEDSTMPPMELARRCVGSLFPHDGSEVGADFSYECAKWGLKSDEWGPVYERFNAAQSVALPCWAAIQVKDGGYTGRFLPRSDPRSVWIGEYTNCCQHLLAMASDCAYHSMESPYGACFVIENRFGEVVAASWAWEGTQGVCFDSLEAKGVGTRSAVVQSMFLVARDKMMALGLPWMRRVTVGSAYGKVFEKNSLRRTLKLTHRRHNYTGAYTDAKKQFLLPVTAALDV